MKKNIVFLVYILFVSNLFAQHNYKEEMIRSGERQEQLEQFQYYGSEYQSHKRTSAWNVKSSQISLLQNTTDFYTCFILEHREQRQMKVSHLTGSLCDKRFITYNIFFV